MPAIRQWQASSTSTAAVCLAAPRCGEERVVVSPCDHTNQTSSWSSTWDHPGLGRHPSAGGNPRPQHQSLAQNGLICRIPGDTEALSRVTARGDRLTPWALRGYDSRFSTGAGPATGRTAGLSPCHPQTRAADERPCGLLGEGLPGAGVVRPGLEQSESPRTGAGKDLGGLRRAPAVARRLPGSARVPAPGGSVIGAGYYCRTQCRPRQIHMPRVAALLSARCRDGQCFCAATSAKVGEERGHVRRT